MLYGALFFIILLGCWVYGDWVDVGGSKEYIDVKAVLISPSPLVRGGTFEVTVYGTVKKTISDMVLEIKVKYSLMLVYSKKIEGKDIKNITFPVSSGPIELKFDGFLPKDAPKGNYTVICTATDKKNRELVKVEIREQVD